MILMRRTLSRMVLTGAAVYVAYRHLQKYEANRAELEAFRAAKTARDKMLADIDARYIAELAELDEQERAMLSAMDEGERVDYHLRQALIKSMPDDWSGEYYAIND